MDLGCNLMTKNDLGGCVHQTDTYSLLDLCVCDCVRCDPQVAKATG